MLSTFRRIVCVLCLSLTAVVAAGEREPLQGLTPSQKVGGFVSIAGSPLPPVPRSSVRTAIRVYEPLLAGLRVFGDRPAVARGCGYLATLYAALGELEKAEGLFAEAQHILETHGGEGRDLAWVNNNRGLVLMENGQYASALRSFRKAVAILDPQREEFLEPRVVALQNLASTYCLLGDGDNSESAYLDALDLLQQLRQEGSRTHQTTRGNLAVLYASMGDYAAARAILEPLIRERGLPQPLRFQILNNLGYVLTALKVFPEAEARLLEAKTMAADGSTQRALTMMNLAAMYGWSGDLERAEETGEQALRLVSELHGETSRSAAAAMANLGTVAFHRGELLKADRLFAQAGAILSKGRGDQEVFIFITRGSAMVAQKRGQQERARTLSRQALDLAKKHLEQMLAYGTETQRLAYQAQSVPYDQLANLGDPGLLAEATLSMKGAVLESLLVERALVRRINAPADQEQLDRINELKVEIMEKIARGDANVDRLDRQLRKEQSALTRRLAALPYPSQPPAGLEALQASLRGDEALVEIVRFQRYAEQGRLIPAYGALTLTVHSAPQWVPLGDADALDPRIERLRTQFRRGGRGGRAVEDRDDEEVVATLRELHDLLWKPLAEVLPSGAKRVLLSPDGALCFLPWSALLDEDGRFLAERWQLTQVNAGRDLLRVAAAGEPRGNTLLALSGTWLTVLSACDTGAGDAHAGEGVLGLRRGFAQAGTKNLLFSLWPVRDDATAKFMTVFYDRLLDTTDAACAFHETQVAELRRWRTERGVVSAAYRAGAFVLTR